MDLNRKQIAKLKQHFHEDFTEGNMIDRKKLKSAFGGTIDEGNEWFGLYWAAKQDCCKIMQQPPLPLRKHGPQPQGKFQKKLPRQSKTPKLLPAKADRLIYPLPKRVSKQTEVGGDDGL